MADINLNLDSSTEEAGRARDAARGMLTAYVADVRAGQGARASTFAGELNAEMTRALDGLDVPTEARRWAGLMCLAFVDLTRTAMLAVAVNMADESEPTQEPNWDEVLPIVATVLSAHHSAEPPDGLSGG